jgi:hypothetical protein
VHLLSIDRPVKAEPNVGSPELPRIARQTLGAIGAISHLRVSTSSRERATNSVLSRVATLSESVIASSGGSLRSNR